MASARRTNASTNVFAMWLNTGPTTRFEHVRRELVGELELDLAGVGGERAKPPLAVQVPERAVAQRHDDRLAGALALSVVKCARTPW